MPPPQPYASWSTSCRPERALRIGAGRSTPSRSTRGDSGGPILLRNTDVIVGMTSFGKSNAGCRGTDFYYRVDRQPVQDFIEASVGD
jgi:secreted trypsin-like serine protease